MSDPEVLRFIHHFGGGVSCEMIVSAQPPALDQMLSVHCEWTGPGPKPKHIPSYRQWVLYSAQLLANRWGLRLLYALGVAPNRTEFWCFVPGATPKLLKKINCGIP